MNAPPTDLVLFYELIKPTTPDPDKEDGKPEPKQTSKPNVPKVEAIARGMILTAMHASSGMATTIGISLRAIQHASTLVLAQSDEGDYEANRTTILNQLQVVYDSIKATQPQQAKVQLKQLQADIEAMVTKGKPAPKGALKDSPAGPTGSGDTPDTNAVEEKVKDALADALGGGPKKDDIVH